MQLALNYGHGEQNSVGWLQNIVLVLPTFLLERTVNLSTLATVTQCNDDRYCASLNGHGSRATPEWYWRAAKTCECRASKTLDVNSRARVQRIVWQRLGRFWHASPRVTAVRHTFCVFVACMHNMYSFSHTVFDAFTRFHRASKPLQRDTPRTRMVRNDTFKTSGHHRNAVHVDLGSRTVVRARDVCHLAVRSKTRRTTKTIATRNDVLQSLPTPRLWGCLSVRFFFFFFLNYYFNFHPYAGSWLSVASRETPSVRYTAIAICKCPKRHAPWRHARNVRAVTRWDTAANGNDRAVMLSNVHWYFYVQSWLLRNH